MYFTGRVYFKYDCADAWMFYRFLRGLATDGGRVAVGWHPMPTEATALAASVHASLAPGNDQGRFLHAMLGLVHIEGLPISEKATVVQALASAGIKDVPVSIDETIVSRLAADAAALGVTSSPSLYRGGPVTAITLNPAALNGDRKETAMAIIAVADNDGIWGLAKP
jgi:hypothetical protein